MSDGARPFTDFLRDQRSGKTHKELSDALQTLVKAVDEVRKPGELVLKIKIKPASKGDMTAVEVVDKIELKLPVGERSSSLFFVTPENNLSRRDTRQEEMFKPTVVEPEPKPAQAAGE